MASGRAAGSVRGVHALPQPQGCGRRESTTNNSEAGPFFRTTSRDRGTRRDGARRRQNREALRRKSNGHVDDDEGIVTVSDVGGVTGSGFEPPDETRCGVGEGVDGIELRDETRDLGIVEGCDEASDVDLRKMKVHGIGSIRRRSTDRMKLRFMRAKTDHGHEAAGEGAFLAVAEEEIGAAGGAEIAREDVLLAETGDQELRPIGVA